MKASPDFWIEINRDGVQEYRPLIGSKSNAYQRMVDITKTDSSIDFVVLLDGYYRPGRVATHWEILADSQSQLVNHSYRVK